ncbi:MAG: sulfatase [Candidatus Hydrogenedentes bacterium]|nr:sulfatase [Candidatus Hydrogenedentota bacterium]
MAHFVSRRNFLHTSVASLAAASCSRLSSDKANSQAKNAKPNLVFVFPDELRRHAIGCMGEDPVITPNLDEFARQGMILTHAISNRPVCSPYRASMLTGRYPFSTGVTTNCWSHTVQYGIHLRESERCIGDVLKDQGYACGYIGKWHLESPCEPALFRHADNSAWDEFTPPGPRRHGFDFWHSYGCHDNHMKPHYWIGNAPRDAYVEFEDWSPRHEAGVAIDFIRNRDGKQRPSDRPFALFVSMNPPHMPFELVPPEYLERYGDKTSEQLLTRPNVNLETELGQTAKRWGKHYFAAVTGVDEQFGRIVQCLREEGLDDNTIVVFTSDHGEMMGSQGRMYKSWWYEESLGVPFIIRWPGHVSEGRDDLLFSVPDVMPTLLGLMGLSTQIPSVVEGTDYSRILRGQNMERPASALYLNHDPDAPRAGARGVRTPRYTYVIERTSDGEVPHLYDNEADPYQTRDIAGTNEPLERSLTAELMGWLEKTGDPWYQEA